MKRIIFAALALSLLSVPAMAESGHRQQAPKYRVEQQNPRWQKGQRLAQNQRKHVVDHKKAHLKSPGRGQEWVQVDEAYVLINIASGVIAAVMAR